MKNTIAAKRSGERMRKAFCRSAALFMLLFLISCSVLPEKLRRESNDSQGAEELLIPVTKGPIASEISFVGNVQYSQSAAMTWKTSGVIGSVYVKPGDRVKKGDILAVLETDSLPASVLLAEKTMIEQEENLENVRSSRLGQMQAYVTLNAKESALIKAKLEQEALYYPRADRQEMERAWDSLALANLNFNYAKQDYDHLVESYEPWEGYEEDRVVTMFGKTFTLGGDSRSGRERKFEDYVSTYNTLVSAYENYLWVIGEPSATDYAVAEGNVQVAQMEYDKALEEYLSYESIPREKDVHLAEVTYKNAETAYNQRYITAQFDGTVTSVDAVEGYYVTRGTAAVRIDDMSHIYIPISIPELDVSTIRTGERVSIVLDALSGKSYSGHILNIAQASESSGSAAYFNAMVEIDDPDSGILAGMTSEISIKVNEKSDALLIPNAAISYTNGVPTVIVDNGTNRERIEIRLGIVSDSVSEVTSENLREGDLLAVSSITRSVLEQLGLDPSVYLSGGRQPVREPASQASELPQDPSSQEVIYMRQFPEAVTETAAPEDEQAPVPETEQGPANTAAEQPQQESSSGYQKPGNSGSNPDSGWNGEQRDEGGQRPGRFGSGPQEPASPTAVPADAERQPGGKG